MGEWNPSDLSLPLPIGKPQKKSYVKAGPLRKKELFPKLEKKKSEKNGATKLKGGG